MVLSQLGFIYVYCLRLGFKGWTRVRYWRCDQNCNAVQDANIVLYPNAQIFGCLFHLKNLRKQLTREQHPPGPLSPLSRSKQQ